VVVQLIGIILIRVRVLRSIFGSGNMARMIFSSTSKEGGNVDAANKPEETATDNAASDPKDVRFIR